MYLQLDSEMNLLLYINAKDIQLYFKKINCIIKLFINQSHVQFTEII